VSTLDTAELPREAPRAGSALSDPAALVTGVAGLFLLAALAAALADARESVPLALAGVGVVFALFLLVPRGVAAVKRHPTILLGFAAILVSPLVLVVLLGLYADSWSYTLDPVRVVAALLPLGIIALAALGGLILIADDLRTRLGLAQKGLTPWQRLTGTADGWVGIASAPWRLVGGLALVGLASVFGLGFIGANSGSGLMQLALLLVLGGGAAAIIATPLLIAGLARSDRARLTTAREDERRRVAAHLHDSVLQTLALVQRQAHDPAAVTRLARRQEHELRAWMAGEVELGTETLGAALRDAVAEVEDEHGTHVELTILGERALDRGTEALVAAAREALRNAARHAPGAPVYVFAQAGPDGAEVFVRDDGPGFELATVPAERRGVRDSILGRMAAVGGSGTVESRPGEGTEIALRIGVMGP
jgi:signal transduction histidine kinase